MFIENSLGSKSTHSSLAVTVGALALAASSFLGCDSPTPSAPPPSIEQLLSRTSLPAIPKADSFDTSGIQAVAPEFTALLNQTTKMEKALRIIVGNTNHRGWEGDNAQRADLVKEFEATKLALLQSPSYYSESSFAPSPNQLFEQLHSTQRLFETNGYGVHTSRGFDNGLDGSMKPFYDLEAQLMLLRIHLSNNQ